MEISYSSENNFFIKRANLDYIKDYEEVVEVSPFGWNFNWCWGGMFLIY